MNLGVMLVHVDCPTRGADHAAPPKLQLIGRDTVLYGHCLACDQWVTVTLLPTVAPPVLVPAESAP
jgi:hypothetical protein